MSIYAESYAKDLIIYFQCSEYKAKTVLIEASKNYGLQPLPMKRFIG